MRTGFFDSFIKSSFTFEPPSPAVMEKWLDKRSQGPDVSSQMVAKINYKSGHASGKVSKDT